VPKARRRRTKRKVEPWSTHEAQQYPQHAREKSDALYAAWVLAVVMAMRRSEILGLTRDAIDLDAGKLRSQDHLQRVGAELLHRETKTEDADDFLPLPPIVVTALRVRNARQRADARAIGDRWSNKLNLVLTKYSTLYKPSHVTHKRTVRQPTSELSGCLTTGTQVPRSSWNSGSTLALLCES
jgi:integrase